MHVWFTVHTHRHEKPGQDGLPASFSPVADLFDLVLELQTEHADVHIKLLKGAAASAPAADSASRPVDHADQGSFVRSPQCRASFLPPECYSQSGRNVRSPTPDTPEKYHVHSSELRLEDRLKKLTAA